MGLTEVWQAHMQVRGLQVTQAQVGFNASRFSALRRRSKWTQQKISNKFESGITRQTVSLWEQGNLVPSFEQIAKLADILRVHITELTTDTLDILPRGQELLLNLWEHDIWTEGASELPYRDVSTIRVTSCKSARYRDNSTHLTLGRFS